MKPQAILLLAVCAMMFSGCTVSRAELPSRMASPSPVNGTATQGSDQGSRQASTERGQQIFKQGKGKAPPCVACHILEQAGYSIGPVMLNVSQRAGSRVVSLNAEQYLRQSILDPNAFLVPGFRSIMYNQYAAHLDEQDILDLIAYLKTL